jgi:hypothetical protein
LIRSERNFCNKKCYIKFQTTQKGEQNHNWKGGLYKFNCKVCSKPCERKKSKLNRPRYCSSKCFAKDITRRGENHWNWKGGNNSRYIKSIAPRPRPEKCEVCGGYGKKRNGIVLDHNHKLGKFRGWLCSNCNTIIGLAKENPQILIALVKYLEINEKSSLIDSNAENANEGEAKRHAERLSEKTAKADAIV